MYVSVTNGVLQVGNATAADVEVVFNGQVLTDYAYANTEDGHVVVFATHPDTGEVISHKGDPVTYQRTGTVTLRFK